MASRYRDLRTKIIPMRGQELDLEGGFADHPDDRKSSP